jgi:hypothetical protein
MRWSLLLFPLAVVVAAVWSVAASATPVAPDPAECRVAPRSFASLRVLAATPAPEPIDTPSDVPTEAELPAGPPADPATVAAIGDVARIYVACVNAWDLPRLLALRTDADVRRFLVAEGPIGAAEYDEMATPLPAPPESRATLLDERDARLLPDGRVGAILVVRHPRPDHDSVTTTLFIFARVDEAWLIDDAIAVGRAGTPVA